MSGAVTGLVLGSKRKQAEQTMKSKSDETDNMRARGRVGVLWSIVFWARHGWALLNGSSNNLHKTHPSTICHRGRLNKALPFPEHLEAINGCWDRDSFFSGVAAGKVPTLL